MTHPVPFVMAPRDPFSGTLLPDSVTVGSGSWEDDAGNTTDADLYGSVNDSSDLTYVQHITPGVSVCSTTENFAIEFGFGNPGSDPNGSETVTYRVRARYAITGGTGTATMRLRMREGTTTKATETSLSLTTSLAWYELVMSSDEMHSVSDWTAIRGLADAEVCVNSAGQEILFQVAEEQIVFSGGYS